MKMGHPWPPLPPCCPSLPPTKGPNRAIAAKWPKFCMAQSLAWRQQQQAKYGNWNLLASVTSLRPASNCYCPKWPEHCHCCRMAQTLNSLEFGLAAVATVACVKIGKLLTTAALHSTHLLAFLTSSPSSGKSLAITITLCSAYLLTYLGLTQAVHGKLSPQ